MRTRSLALVLAGVLCGVGCSSANDRKTSSATASAEPMKPLRGRLKVDAVLLETGDAQGTRTAVRDKIHAQLAALDACATSGGGDEHVVLWMGARITSEGKVENTVVSADSPAKAASCAVDVLAKTTFAKGPATAVSVVLVTEAAPPDCKGTDCSETPEAVTAAPGATGPAAAGSAAASSAPASSASARDRRALALREAADFGMISFEAVDPLDNASRGLGGGGTSRHPLDPNAFKGLGRPQSPASPQPYVGFGEVTVSGSIAPEVIKRIIRAHLGNLRQCYEKPLTKDASLAGTVTAAFTIQTDGKSQDLDTSKSAIASPELVDCAVKELGGIGYLAPEGGAAKAVLVIEFAPSKNQAPTVIKRTTTIDSLTAPSVTAALEPKGWKLLAVPGTSAEEPFVVFGIKAKSLDFPTSGNDSGVSYFRRSRPGEGTVTLRGPETEKSQLTFHGPQESALETDLHLP